MRRLCCISFLIMCIACHGVEASDVNVGAAAVNLVANDSMVIGGGILPKFAKGQEGELRAVAVVIEKPTFAKLAIVACDVLFVTRDIADAAIAEIEESTGIPARNILINATHTHHAPSTAVVHGYGREQGFCQQLQRAIVAAVQQANSQACRWQCCGFTFSWEKRVLLVPTVDFYCPMAGFLGPDHAMMQFDQPGRSTRSYPCLRFVAKTICGH